MIETLDQPATPALLTYEQASERLTTEGLKVSARTLQRHVAAGLLRVIKTGHRTLRIRAVDLEKWKRRFERGGVL